MKRYFIIGGSLIVALIIYVLVTKKPLEKTPSKEFIVHTYRTNLSKMINIGDTRAEVVRKLHAMGVEYIDSTMSPEMKGLSGSYQFSFADAEMFGHKWILNFAVISPNNGLVSKVDWMCIEGLSRATFDSISSKFNEEFGQPKETSDEKTLNREWFSEGGEATILRLFYTQKMITLDKLIHFNK